MIRKRTGIVTKILEKYEKSSLVLILSEDKEEKAFNYNYFTGEIKVGDRVFINTNALSLNLGTGGYNYVMNNLSNQYNDFSYNKGHIQKLRYTPYQIKVLSIEEPDSEYHTIIKQKKKIDGMKVLICPLHSMILPACLLLNQLYKVKNISYIMSDSASLPLDFSNTVRKVKNEKLINATITCGQAFGGDFEAVNIYTGLIFSKHCLNSDLTIISPGPGVVGTSTPYGFSGIEEGHIIDIVNNLSGIPVVVPRISFCDKRLEHYGISHHTITTLATISYSKSNIGLPFFGNQKNSVIYKQITNNKINIKHDIFYLYEETIDFLNIQEGFIIETMGKNYTENKEFFKAIGASTKLISLL